MPLIVIAFFSYWVFVRHELMFLDIIIYIAAMVGAVLLARRWRNVSWVQRLWPLWCFVAVLGIIAIGILTYHAPDWIIFADLG
ncbi:MAG: hypothetical protein J5635_01685, partial [Paludibacteraceae bacterium]|nr:hypothetical protein [Paludibacteraceae bacterium]